MVIGMSVWSGTIGTLFFALAASLAAGPGTFALPYKAKIVVKRAMSLPGALRDDKEECPTFHLTEMQVRRRFKTFHPVTLREVHDSYLEPACEIRGEIVHGNRRFQYKTNAGDLLWTNWPSGKWAILGGEPSITEEMKRAE